MSKTAIRNGLEPETSKSLKKSIKALMEEFETTTGPKKKPEEEAKQDDIDVELLSTRVTNQAREINALRRRCIELEKRLNVVEDYVKEQTNPEE